MIPVTFAEKNRTLKKPPEMTHEECASLDVFTDGKQCISKWKMSWTERIHCLFRGYVWVSVFSGHTQPPIWISGEKTVFKIEGTNGKS